MLNCKLKQFEIFSSGNFEMACFDCEKRFLPKKSWKVFLLIEKG